MSDSADRDGEAPAADSSLRQPHGGSGPKVRDTGEAARAEQQRKLTIESASYSEEAIPTTAVAESPAVEQVPAQLAVRP